MLRIAGQAPHRDLILAFIVESDRLWYAHYNKEINRIFVSYLKIDAAMSYDIVVDDTSQFAAKIQVILLRVALFVNPDGIFTRGLGVGDIVEFFGDDNQWHCAEVGYITTSAVVVVTDTEEKVFNIPDVVLHEASFLSRAFRYIEHMDIFKYRRLFNG